MAQHQTALVKATRSAAQRDALADTVIGAVEAAFQKLAEHRDEIIELWSEFASLQPGETIKGCHTKKEFCEVHLRRDIRSVQYMLKGGNFNRGETVSPTVVQVDHLSDLPPLTGNIRTDNKARLEYLHARGLAYPHCEDGKVIVPFVSNDAVLAALVNEQGRVLSLGDGMKAAELEGVIERYISEGVLESEEARRKRD